METEPRLLSAFPPFGHVVCGGKWRDSPLVGALKGDGVKILFENELRVADFLLPNRSSIFYVSECDVVAGKDVKRKLVRYRNTPGSSQELVLLEKSPLSEQHFSGLQKLVVLELGLPLLPVAGQAEAAQLLTQMVRSDGRENAFRRRSCCRLLDSKVLTLVQQIPGVGRVKAAALLQSFPSMQLLCGATPAELEPLVGAGVAQQIHGFLHRNTP